MKNVHIIALLLFVCCTLQNCVAIKKSFNAYLCSDPPISYSLSRMSNDSLCKISTFYTFSDLDSLVYDSKIYGKLIIRFKNGVRHGLSEAWYSSGIKGSQANYINDYEVAGSRIEFDSLGNTSSKWIDSSNNVVDTII